MDRKEVDLHIHSKYSDGRNDISELTDLVKKANLKAAVLTDHDRIGGLKDFMIFCEENSIDSMSGIEISSTDTTSSSYPQTIDVLGYGFNPEILLRDDNDILEHNLNVRVRYIKKVLDMYRRKRVVDFSVESLGGHFKLPQKVSNKYWLIAARMENLLTSIEVSKALEIARKELKRGGDYFVERENYVSTREAISAIRLSGGIAVWAHPTKTMEKLAKKHTNSEKIFSTILDRMVHEGLDGLEFNTPYGDDYKKMLMKYAEKYEMIVTGGSDYHEEFGLIKDNYLGKGGISYEEFLQIKKLFV